MSTIKNQESSPYEFTKSMLKRAVQDLGLSESVYNRLASPMRSVEVSIPVKLDNGEHIAFTGYRCQHSDLLGPCKGGIRFHPNVNLDEVRALSMWMSFKSAIVGLPYGGGKGGVIVDPSKLSQNELEQLSRGYVRALFPVIGPEKDIPAPDVNTNAKIMGWMVDEYSKLRGFNSPGVITGKPLILGGSHGRVEATGRGVAITIIEAAKRLGIDLANSTAAIQGFGNVGSMVAQFLSDVGVKIVAVSGSRGGIYNEDGLNLVKLRDYVKENKSVIDFPGSKSISNEDLLTLDVDLLVPAALSNQITEHNAPNIRAKLVAEGANGPTTPAADEILDAREIFVIPEILSNAGGVTVSYLEWVQNMTGYYWSEDEVNAKMHERMVASFDNIYNLSQQNNVSMRRAAYMAGVQRLHEAMQAKGQI